MHVVDAYYFGLVRSDGKACLSRCCRYQLSLLLAIKCGTHKRNNSISCLFKPKPKGKCWHFSNWVLSS